MMNRQLSYISQAKTEKHRPLLVNIIIKLPEYSSIFDRILRELWNNFELLHIIRDGNFVSSIPFFRKLNTEVQLFFKKAPYKQIVYFI